MNTRDRINKWWRRSLLRLAGVSRKNAPYVWPSWQIGQPAWKMTNFENYTAEGFAHNSIIYQALMFKARAMAQVQFRAYRGTLDAPELLPPDHQLSRLMERPNPHMSSGSFLMLQELSLNIDGNAYAIKTPGTDNESELWPLRPDRVYILPDANRRRLLGYVYVPEGSGIQDGTPILASDMLHVKFPNPADPLEGIGYGASPMASLARTGDVDNSVTDFLKHFWDKGAMVWYTLETEQDITDDVAARLKARFNELYGGWENWGVAVLDNGTSLKRASLTFDEMNFDTLDERAEIRMVGPFGVPLELLATRMGMYRSTYNNRREARRMFWEDTMLPEIHMFESEMRYHLNSNDGSFIMADLSEVPAMQIEVAGTAQAFASFVEHGIPINAAIDLLNLQVPYQDNGDIPLLVSNLVLAEDVLNPPEPAPTPPQLRPFTGEEEMPVESEPAGNEDDYEGAPSSDEDEDEITKYMQLIPVGTDPSRWLQRAQHIRLQKRKLADLRMKANTLAELKKANRLLMEVNRRE